MFNFDPFSKEPSFKHDEPERTGVLLINLGTPDAPTAQAVKPYLRQFLSDQRVVELPSWLWQVILRGIILNVRPKKSAAKYASIWSADGSPLKCNTEKLSKKVKGWLGAFQNTHVVVEYAMRYGNPSIDAILEKMRSENVNKLLIIPLYPQYASSSTGSAMDGVFAALAKRRNMPSLRSLRNFHDHPAYIGALVDQVRSYWQNNGRGNHLLMSFHGVPQFSLDRGDPYFCECHKTGRLLAEALGLAPSEYTISFQSRFGKTEWIKPYTSNIVHELGNKKTSRLDVICPGFVADCLETLEEIAIETKSEFLQAGGKEFHYIPALNDGESWVRALGTIIQEELKGWPVTPMDAAALRQRKELAIKTGAKN